MNLDTICVSDLITQVIVEKLVTVPNQSGGQVPPEGLPNPWVYEWEFWAAVEWSSPRRMVVADRVQLVHTCKLGTHWDPRFVVVSKRRLRIVGPNVLLEITGAQNYKQRYLWALIDAEKGSGQ